MANENETGLVDLTKPEPTRGRIKIGQHLDLDWNDYNVLRNYLTTRIQYSYYKTTWRASRADEIDRQLLGYIELEGKDKARAENNRAGKAAKVTDVNLSLGQSQIDTAVTALLDMLVPTDKMYEPFGSADTQSAAIAVTKELNKSADKFNHISEYYKVFSDALRYDLGGLEVVWTNQTGSRIENDALTGTARIVPNTVVFSGNKLKALDIRNTFYDLTVSPEKVSTDGGYAGYVEVIGIPQLNEMIDRGEVSAEYVCDTWEPTNDLIEYNYKPVFSNAASHPKDTQTRTLDNLFGITMSPDKAIFMITMYVRLRAKPFKLADQDGQTIWRFRLIGSRIVSAEPLDNAHGRLPIVLTSATCDSLGENMLSYAETLLHMQNFASFLINAKQRGYRKQLYGVTFYDKNKIDMRQALNSVRDNDFENLYVPVDVSDGQAVGSLVQQFNDAPDTAATLADLGSVIELMQTLLPTDSRQSLANLSRVSQWQAQRTVRETDKRTIKIGRLLNASLIAPVIYQSVYNLLQYKDTVTLLNDDGTTQEVTIGELRGVDLELKISSALRGIDKDLAADRLRDVINSLIQVPNISADVNIIGLVRYWSTLMGLDIDLAQFKVESPFDKLTPEQKNAAYQLLNAYMQQAQAMGATSASDDREAQQISRAGAPSGAPSMASMAITD